MNLPKWIHPIWLVHKPGMILSDTNKQEETVKWKGKPAFMPYLLNGLSLFYKSLLIQGLLLALLILLYIIDHQELHWRYIIIPFCITLSVDMIILIRRITHYRNTLYTITNKRIYIKNGFLETYSKKIDKDKIKNLDISETNIDQKYKVSTILIWAGELKMGEYEEEKVIYKFESVKDPYDILRLF